jgi:ElaB/YqjD/DUF883 family membrane-anchored ribosome-binding protein
MADAKDQAKDAINEGADRAKKAAEAVAEKAGEVMSGVRGYAEQVAGQSREVAERTQEGIRRAGAVIHENPGPSVAMAFGVGIAFGAIIGLSLRSSRA